VTIDDNPETAEQLDAKICHKIPQTSLYAATGRYHPSGKHSSRPPGTLPNNAQTWKCARRGNKVLGSASQIE
jgi:hypothetical protein